MSFLIDERIVLNKVTFDAEKIEGKKQGEPSPRAVVRAVRTKLSEELKLPLGDVRFRVVINGVAADASDVASLICKLDDSPYFCQVVLSFSRTAEINVTSNASLRSKRKNMNSSRESGGKIQVSEFEISCYLANYREESKVKKQ